MDSIQLMIEEHNNILRMNKTIRIACKGILENKKVDTFDFRLMIDFIKNYADKHHHAKEEQILFLQMQDKLGDTAKNLIKHGMLVEHDLGRLFVFELEKALIDYDKSPGLYAMLDILSSAIGYTKLLNRHIEKENNAVYNYAIRNLSKDVIDEINLKTDAFEKEPQSTDAVKRNLLILQGLEKKYSE